MSLYRSYQRALPDESMDVDSDDLKTQQPFTLAVVNYADLNQPPPAALASGLDYVFQAQRQTQRQTERHLKNIIQNSDEDMFDDASEVTRSMPPLQSLKESKRRKHNHMTFDEQQQAFSSQQFRAPKRSNKVVQRLNPVTEEKLPANLRRKHYAVSLDEDQPSGEQLRAPKRSNKLGQALRKSDIPKHKPFDGSSTMLQASKFSHNKQLSQAQKLRRHLNLRNKEIKAVDSLNELHNDPKVLGAKFEGQTVKISGRADADGKLPFTATVIPAAIEPTTMDPNTSEPKINTFWIKAPHSNRVKENLSGYLQTYVPNHSCQIEHMHNQIRVTLLDTLPEHSSHMVHGAILGFITAWAQRVSSLVTIEVINPAPDVKMQ